ncbi:hypothetical protein C8J56DRAFT_895109 [Mycena floridula]|nr:hypothetical protein C8J56DRAFT_896672 [Mycena floridula]KAJ7582322.1 hypothetical protein C8J56DRAFT_895109 [Mycena floridula]
MRQELDALARPLIISALSLPQAVTSNTTQYGTIWCFLVRKRIILDSPGILRSTLPLHLRRDTSVCNKAKEGEKSVDPRTVLDGEKEGTAERLNGKDDLTIWMTQDNSQVTKQDKAMLVDDPAQSRGQPGNAGH